MIYNRRFLRAKKHITCQHSPLNHIAPEVKLVSVNDLMLTANLNWMKKRYPNFKDSIEGAGMIYPIIYTDLEHYWLLEKGWPKDAYSGIPIPGIAVHTGNKRVYWAKRYGYTHIEGYYVENIEEQKAIVKQTFMSKESYPNV